MNSSRRGFLTGLGAALITAPAIVRAGSLMPVKQMIEPVYFGIDLATGLDTTVWFFQNRYFWVNAEEPQMIHWATKGARETWMFE